MPSKVQILGFAVVLGCLTAGPEVARADKGCEPALTSSIRDTQALAYSIRVDKPGLARVYAADGSEFTAGQAHWMKGQMQRVDKACARGDLSDAEQRLASVQALLAAHKR